MAFSLPINWSAYLCSSEMNSRNSFWEIPHLMPSVICQLSVDHRLLGFFLRDFTSLNISDRTFSLQFDYLMVGSCIFFIVFSSKVKTLEVIVEIFIYSSLRTMVFHPDTLLHSWHVLQVMHTHNYLIFPPSYLPSFFLLSI